jgi:alkylhydroperoxidase family enzyme
LSRAGASRNVRRMSSDPFRPLDLDELPEELRGRLAPRVDRLGYLGSFFTHAGYQPAALMHFHDFTEALKEALPARMVEIVALTIAGDTGNAYERIQHERLALAIGMDREEVHALSHGRLNPFASFSTAERAAHALATCVTKHFGTGCGPAFLRLRRLVGDETAVACLLLTGRYVAHATIANTWALEVPVPSPFDDSDERAG